MSFRHCTASADRMAKTSYQSWVESGVIPHPLIALFVNNVDTCLADMWKVCMRVSSVCGVWETGLADQKRDKIFNIVNSLDIVFGIR